MQAGAVQRNGGRWATHTRCRNRRLVQAHRPPPAPTAQRHTRRLAAAAMTATEPMRCVSGAEQERRRPAAPDQLLHDGAAAGREGRHPVAVLTRHTGRNRVVVGGVEGHADLISIGWTCACASFLVFQLRRCFLRVSTAGRESMLMAGCVRLEYSTIFMRVNPLSIKNTPGRACGLVLHREPRYSMVRFTRSAALLQGAPGDSHVTPARRRRPVRVLPRGQALLCGRGVRRGAVRLGRASPIKLWCGRVP